MPQTLSAPKRATFVIAALSSYLLRSRALNHKDSQEH
jgi:hypothetical protein